MSFQDLEAGVGSQRRQQDASQAVASGIFRINTAVNSYYRLVNSIGTPKDTFELREKLHKIRSQISELVRDASAKLKEATETDRHGDVSPLRKIADAKLAKDFQSVLKEFQKAQRLAAEREISYAPVVSKEALPTSYSAQESDTSSGSLQQALLESKRQEVLLLDNEITFNEAVIEERDQGIREVQEQIGEVNEIFKDLAVLVHEQGIVIDDVSSNIENSHAATVQATSQLRKAAKSQKSVSSLTCLLILIFGIMILIVIIVIVF